MYRALASLVSVKRYVSSSMAGPAPSKLLGRPLLGRYTVLPVELFRINSSEQIRLRDYAEQSKRGRTSYDLRLGSDGLVHPSDGENYICPNGASVRPEGSFLQELITGFMGRNTVIYRLPQGLELPPDLICLHEFSDHHSLQCSKPMTLKDLNAKLTKLCIEHGEKLSKTEFAERYPF
ncbi:MAG: hypothetical protein CYPHOPRED_003607 [Cyphobasidiales sp. Tagirdzhanova-0007]|nr:MAG: hypothetical protein CYPHOPRED_003607 [Cyphobasidiales sp. Tagirdzhanova-0007]